jgi:NADPH:quinone reductase-like Zn-dependent oxidoreductase
MGSLQSSETVLIHNVGGGVGLAALDIANKIGATVYGTASKTKHDFLSKRGLKNAIDYKNEDWVKAVMKLTDDNGVDLILDPLGGSHFKKSYKTLRSTGRLGMFGISSTSESGFGGKLRLLKTALQMPFFHSINLMNSNKGVYGLNMDHLWHEYGKIRTWMAHIFAGVSEGWIKPHYDKVFNYDQAGDAHAYIEGRHNLGKVILVP